MKISVYLVVFLLTVSIIAKVFGTLQPPNPALRGFVEGCEDKPQPCWYGIVLGKTKPNEAKNALWQYGFVIADEYSNQLIYSVGQKGCSAVLGIQNKNKNDFQIGHIVFAGCNDVRLGELMLHLGKPQRSAIGIMFSSRSIVEVSDYKWYTAPFDIPPWFVLLSSHSLAPQYQHKWHGFISKWRYCQLEPRFTGCPI